MMQYAQALGSLVAAPIEIEVQSQAGPDVEVVRTVESGVSFAEVLSTEVVSSPIYSSLPPEEQGSSNNGSDNAASYSWSDSSKSVGPNAESLRVPTIPRAQVLEPMSVDYVQRDRVLAEGKAPPNAFPAELLAVATKKAQISPGPATIARSVSEFASAVPDEKTPSRANNNVWIAQQRDQAAFPVVDKPSFKPDMRFGSENTSADRRIALQTQPILYDFANSRAPVGRGSEEPDRFTRSDASPLMDQQQMPEFSAGAKDRPMAEYPQLVVRDMATLASGRPSEPPRVGQSITAETAAAKLGEYLRLPEKTELKNFPEFRVVVRSVDTVSRRESRSINSLEVAITNAEPPKKKLLIEGAQTALPTARATDAAEFAEIGQPPERHSGRAPSIPDTVNQASQGHLVNNRTSDLNKNDSQSAAMPVERTVHPDFLHDTSRQIPATAETFRPITRTDAGLPASNPETNLVALTKGNDRASVEIRDIEQALGSAIRTDRGSDVIAVRPSDPPVIGRNVIQQLSAQIMDTPNFQGGTSIEVTLSPKELGTVKLSLSPQDAGMSVLVQAERQDTLELIRRNVELLAQDLRQQGHQNLSFQFGQGEQPADQKGFADLGEDDPVQSPSPVGTQKNGASREPLHNSRLDIRI